MAMRVAAVEVQSKLMRYLGKWDKQLRNADMDRART